MDGDERRTKGGGPPTGPAWVEAADAGYFATPRAPLLPRFPPELARTRTSTKCVRQTWDASRSAPPAARAATGVALRWMPEQRGSLGWQRGAKRGRTAAPA